MTVKRYVVWLQIRVSMPAHRIGRVEAHHRSEFVNAKILQYGTTMGGLLDLEAEEAVLGIVVYSCSCQPAYSLHCVGNFRRYLPIPCL